MNPEVIAPPLTFSIQLTRNNSTDVPGPVFTVVFQPTILKVKGEKAEQQFFKNRQGFEPDRGQCSCLSTRLEESNNKS